MSEDKMKLEREKALKFKKLLEAGSLNYESHIQGINRCCKDGDFSLVYIGLSEEKLEALRIKGCEFSANDLLQKILKATEDPEVKKLLGLLGGEVEKGELVFKSKKVTEEVSA